MIVKEITLESENVIWGSHLIIGIKMLLVMPASHVAVSASNNSHSWLHLILQCLLEVMTIPLLTHDPTNAYL